MGECKPVSRPGSVHSSQLFGNTLSLAPSMDMTLDRRKSKGAESDCTMVTLLQPTHMLRSEIGLHEAARKNQPDLIKKLLAAKVDVNSRNNTDRTALHWACASGHSHIIKLLLLGNADVEAEDKYGMRAMLWAAWFGHVDAMKILVNNGADVRCVNKQGMDIIHCAAHNNHVNILKFVVDSLDGFKFNAFDKNDKTPLHSAAQKGNLEAVDHLLSINCDPGIKDKAGRTAIHLSASEGHDEVLKKLLLVGVEVNDRDNDGKTALHLAAEGGHVKVAEALLACTADPNAETTKEMTALQIAATSGHVEFITCLIDNRCNLNSLNNGNTALHLAAIHDEEKVLRALLDAGCTLDVQNLRGMTALHCAVEAGLADATEILLIASADLHITEKQGKNALGLASRGSFVGIVDMIIKAYRHQEAKKEAMVHRIQCGAYHHCFYSATCNAFSSTPRLRDNDEKMPNNSLQFKRTDRLFADQIKEILWRLATKHFKHGDWKKLARHWKFTEDHIKAIEHQYTGTTSFHEHGYRMLLIWLHGVAADDNPMKELFEALSAIDRRDLAELTRKKGNQYLENIQSVKDPVNSVNHKQCVIS